jgi:uncharacterized protein YndB with AHSA1/START domain
VTPPLTITVDVACPTDHAFALWTTRIGTWWPSDHTVTGQPDLAVVLEGGVGGRIYERTSDGVEHDWGEVTLWEPPDRLSYLWHLGRDRTDATQVDVRFAPAGPDSTRVTIEHRGWEHFGEQAESWRARNRAGWDTVLPHFEAALAKGM